MATGQNHLNRFDRSLVSSELFPLVASGIEVFQVNMGMRCNQACRHCHVEAGPSRPEVMGPAALDACLELVKRERFPVVDITGGAPEMNPGYRRFVEGCASTGAKVKTRTNLTILLEEGYGSLPSFWAENRIEVIASFPYYLEDVFDRQRGRGSFAGSIEALKMLNASGYGALDGLVLNLVYNPCGAFLPPKQKAIEADFRRELERRHNLRFTNLFTLTNMPVGRFLDFLRSSGNLDRYMERLQKSYNPAAAANVMCRNTLSVGWDGGLYDCDFNQMLGLRCDHGSPDDIRRFNAAALGERRIVTGAHCFGCTAGAGSSCTGSVAGC